MFENRRRQRRKNTLLLVVGLILLSAFSFAYYLNYGGNDSLNKRTASNNDPTGYRIPDSIKNPVNPGIVIPQIPKVDAAEPEDRSTTVNTDNFIKPNTKVIFKTYFTLCGHMMDKEPQNQKELINFTEEQLKIKYTDWSVKEFSPLQVILTREIQTYCPRHFIIGIDEKHTNIAIYVYDLEGKKVLHAETETPISILTPEDQAKLEYGIVADSEDELQEKLEGFSE